MPNPRSQPARRKPRRDAQQNRDRILEVAKQAFAKSGANARLDDISKQAQVGAGTLYRHFPTRDALLEAVYHNEVDGLKKCIARGKVAIQGSRSNLCLFGDIVQPGICTGLGKRLLGYFENTVAILLRIAARLPPGRLRTWIGHTKQPCNRRCSPII